MENENSNRRRFIQKILGLTAAGALAGFLQQKTGLPSVEAADGDPLIIGQFNVGNSSTALTSSSACTFGGENWSTSGKGVSGWAATSSGSTRGVEGRSESTSGIGVHGIAAAWSGSTLGVRGDSQSPSGCGVLGSNSLGIGVKGVGLTSVFGQSASTGGTGVHGWASASSGSTRGVYGQSDSTGGVGVYGLHAARSGLGYGLVGKTNSPSGYALRTVGTSAFGGTILPTSDNAYDCGSSSRRWKLVRAVTITPGDLVFENKFKVTEDDEAGLAFKNDAGEKIAVLDREGNLHIKGEVIKDL